MMIENADVTVYEVTFRYPGDPLPTCYRTTNYGRAVEFIRLILTRDFVLESFYDIGFTTDGFNEFKEIFEP